MIRRLRSAHTPEQLAAVYPDRYDHTRWPDHVQRVDATVALGVEWFEGAATIADLSCGDGTIATCIGAAVDADRVILGDLIPGWELSGPIEQTVANLGHVDLYVCTETLEHVDDPERLLAKIRSAAFGLLLSTPVAGEDGDNIEHYWAWDRVGVEELLTATGWEFGGYAELETSWYTFGVWGCR